MAQIYNRLSKTAERLIKKYGYNKVEYQRQSDVKNGWKNEFQTVTVIVDIIVLPSPKYSRESFRLQGEKAMLDNNNIAYMPYSDFVPNINDSFKINNKTFTVQSVVELNPNGKQILYKLELK